MHLTSSPATDSDSHSASHCDFGMNSRRHQIRTTGFRQPPTVPHGFCPTGTVYITHSLIFRHQNVGMRVKGRMCTPQPIPLNVPPSKDALSLSVCIPWSSASNAHRLGALLQVLRCIPTPQQGSYLPD